MGRLFSIDREGDSYSCNHCNTPLALANDVISGGELMRTFFGILRSLLYDSVNVTLGDEYSRQMITGRYTIAEIFWVKCGSNVGWKYVSAQRQTEQYRVGKFILKRFMVLGPDGSENVPPVSARQTEQYKVGKFILKRLMILGPDGSENVPHVKCVSTTSEA